MSEEIWKPIPEFPKYEISNYGRIRSYHKNLQSPEIKKGSFSQGYMRVGLRKDKKSYSFTVHTLVALVFIGPKPEGMQVCHNDNNPKNNHVDNLRYDTPKGNMSDSLKVSKLDILTMKELREMRYTVKRIAMIFKISEGYVYLLTFRKEGY